VASLEGYPVKSSQVKSSQADSVVLLGPGSILEGVPRGYAVQGPGGFGVTGLDWTGLDWTGLDWTGLDWTGLVTGSGSLAASALLWHQSSS